jgi:hypothetical protein
MRAEKRAPILAPKPPKHLVRVKGKSMTIPIWAYRIWKTRTGHVLNTHRAEGPKLEKLVSELAEEINISWDEAVIIVARAWALYVCADPPLYQLENKRVSDSWHGKPYSRELEGTATVFPLSSFIEVSRGYVVAAVDDGELNLRKLPTEVTKLLPRYTR